MCVECRSTYWQDETGGLFDVEQTLKVCEYLESGEVIMQRVSYDSLGVTVTVLYVR